MNYNNDGDGEGWAWQGQDYILEDKQSTDVPKSLMLASDKRDSRFGYGFDDTTTPLKACSDLSYHLAGHATQPSLRYQSIAEEQYREPHSQFKRRRVLQFEPDFLDSSLCNSDMYLRSEEMHDSFEDDLSKISDWVAGFSENTNEFLDPSSERWIEECFNDDEMQICGFETTASDVQNDVNDTNEITTPVPRATSVEVIEKLPVHTTQNLTLKGKKSYMRTPPKLASSIVYPFTFIKPCGVHGDMTLKDINERLNTPKSNKREESSVSLPTSAISGKPVVRKTKIKTEGGGGSITIVRTKG